MSNKTVEKGTGTAFDFIDLFSGCGGLSLGLANAGWHGSFAVEKHPDAFETLRLNLVENENRNHNHYDWPEWLPQEAHDIRKLLGRYKRQLADLSGRVKLVAGGPPCQGFSMAGRRQEGDVRNTLIKEYVKFVKLVKPEYLILENVEGITHKFKTSSVDEHVNLTSSSYSERLVRDLDRAGYRPFPKIIYSSNFAIPQRRPRFVLLGIRKDKLDWLPEEEMDKFSPFKYADDVRKSFLRSKKIPSGKVTPHQALSDLQTSRGTLDCEDSPGFKQTNYKGPNTIFQNLMREGMNGKAPNSLRLARHSFAVSERFKKTIDFAIQTGRQGVSLSPQDRALLGIRKHSCVVLHPKKTTHTVTTLPDDIIHYREPRILTVRENARLQTFPDWFEFTGKYTTGGALRKIDCPRYTQVGNAVPPFLGEFLGLLVKKTDEVLCELEKERE